MSVVVPEDPDHERVELRWALLRAEARIAALRRDLGQSPGSLHPDPEPLLERIAQLDSVLAVQARHLEAFQLSTIWRASWPLRRWLERHPRLARSGGRVLRVAWRTLTRQSPRLRQEAPERADAAPELVLAAPELPTLPVSAKPVVSIIIPAYGQADVTLRCLRAIAASQTETPYEVIVSEDASGIVSEDASGTVSEDASEDAPDDLLGRVAGLRLLRQPVNLGFLHNCNEAALYARGRYLLFLNNDTEPKPGFLDALVRLAEARPEVGLVGSKLLFPDGRLQEAGGILWQDGTGWNYGRGDDPVLPQYNTIRETDYLSGASILLRRDLFEMLGGFDPLFAPAYYEDTDLAFRVRAQGLKVVYQPASVVIHHEGLSHGTDPTTGIKAQQGVNRHRMVARWPKMLASEHFPSGHDPMRASEHAKGCKAILVIDHYVPEPDRDAGSRSALAIMAALRDAGWVVKFWPQNRASNRYTPLLETIGIEVLDHRLPASFETWFAAHGERFDHVLTLRPTVAAEFVSSLLRHTHARLSFYGLDVHHLRMRRQAALTGDLELARAADEMERLERRLWGLFDVVLYPSEDEAALVRRAVPHADARAIVAFSFDRFAVRTTPPAGSLVLFVAGFAHPPNIDAAEWLVQHILPLIRQAVPEVTLVLAGSHPTEAVRVLAGGAIEVTGSVDHETLMALYRSARVAIVPLRAGAGVKGKVVEAMQQGVPLVTTRIGAEGLAGLDAVAAVADEAGALAEAVVALLTDDAAWISRSAAQTAYVARRFSRSALASRLFEALEPPASAQEQSRLA